MEEKKQNENKLLHTIADNINKKYEQPKDQPIDLIKEKLAQNNFLGGQRQPIINSVPQKEELQLPKPKKELKGVEVDGYFLPIVGIPTVDACTILMFLLGTVWSKNPEVDRILKKINLELQDAHGKKYYPRPQKKKN